MKGYGENGSRSWNEGGYPSNHGTQINRGNSFDYSVSGRALLRPEEVLSLSDDYLIAFQRGIAPILAKRIKYYRDPAFALCLGMRVKSVLRWAFLVIGGAWALATLCGY